MPVLGIGLVLLLGFVYALYGLGWLETARVDGLYSLGLPGLRPRARTHPGFGGFLRMVWHQFIDPSMWRAVASAAISTILGLVVLPLLSIFASGIVLAFAPLFARSGAVRLVGTGIDVPVAWASVVGVLAALIAFVAIVGIALLHGVLARVIVVPTREAQLTEQARTSDAQRAGAIRASEVERTRIERDLHDGVQPRLVSVGMTLGLAQQKIDDDPQAAKELLAEAHTSTKAAITELRQLARGIHASVLDDRGLDAALSALAGRSHIPVHLDVRLDTRCRPRRGGGRLLRDRGDPHQRGQALPRQRVPRDRASARRRHAVGAGRGQRHRRRAGDAGGGLDGISNRILAAGGTVRLDSPQGGPTSLEVSVPCAS